ncbi:MAG: hypothetical protein RMH74_07425 [Candidatus Caldarchaeum sp.]|nr:hypothetical protein [Candidatus Caldarchaeum sp.]
MRTSAIILSFLVSTAYLTLFQAHGSTLQVVDLVWGTVSNPEKAIPGDQKIELSLVVANVGNKPVCALEAEISPKLNTRLPITSWEPGKPVKAFYQSQLASGTMATLVFRVNVLEDVRPGRYDADLKLLYRECSSTSDALPTAQHVSTVALQIYSPPSIRIVRSAWFVDGAETTVGPGSGPAVLRVYVEAPVDTPISNVEARISTPKGFSGSTLYDTFLDTIAAGRIFTLDFPLIVSEEVSVGMHQFEADIKFRNKYGTLISLRQSFNVEVLGKEELLVEAVQQTLSKGSYGSLQLIVRNKGSAPAHSVEVVLSSEDPKIRFSAQRLSLGTIQPRQTMEVKAAVYIDKSLEPSVYTATATLEYRDSFANLRAKSFKVPLAVVEEFRRGFKASASQSFLSAGAATSMELTFTNQNPYEAKEVKITLSTNNPSLTIVEGETRAVIESIRAGGTYTMPLKILATSQAGDSVSSVSASVEYRDPSGVRWVENLEVSLAVRADIDIKFRGVQLSPLKVRPGEAVDVAGDVVNEGSNIARAVVVEIGGNPPYEALGESRTVVGIVNPSQVSAFTLNFRVQSNAQPGTYNVVVKVAYRNGFGEVFERETVLRYEVVPNQTPQTTVVSGSQQRFDLQPVLAVVIAVAALAIAGISLRRRRKQG